MTAIGKVLDKMAGAHPWLFSLVNRIRNGRDIIKALQAGSFSQHGEDKFILDYFGRPGRYVDIGASHPVRISSTYLLYRNGWRGVTVEPIRTLYRAQRRWRPRDIQVNSGVGDEVGKLTFFEVVPHVLSTFDEKLARQYLSTGKVKLRRRYEVPVRPAADILRDTSMEDAELLCLDVEGLELTVLRSIDWSRFRPKMVVIELHTALGEANDAGEINQFLVRRGYKMARTFGVNAIYINH